MRENYLLLRGFCQKKLTDSGGFIAFNGNWHNIFIKRPMAFCLFFLTAFLGGGFAPLLAQTVTIGTGTSGSNLAPLNRYYGNSASELLYLGSEMGNSGVITSIGFNKLSGTNNDPIEAVTIYMKTTAETTVGTSATLVGYTQVYSGSFTNTAAPAWQTVTLTTPFVYPSTDSNLSILVVKGFQQWTNSAADAPNYAYTSTSTNYRASYYQNDSTPWSSALTRTYNRPNVQLELTALPTACATPASAASVTLSAITSNSVTGTITAPETAPAGYLVIRSTTESLTTPPSENVLYSAGNPLGGGTVVASSASATFTDTGVSPNTHYYYFVYAYNYDGTFTCLGPAYADAAVTADTTTCSTFPSVIGVSNITSTTATLNWTSIVGAGGSAATYTVGVYTDAAYTNEVETYTTANLSQNLTGLTNGTVYYYRIQGATAGACSDPAYATGSFTAQPNFTPIDVTGFNFDVIANGTGLPGTTTDNAVDGGDYAYISTDYKAAATSAAVTYGLPLNRTLTNPTNADIKFFLQDYSENNSLRLAVQNTAGTLTLAQPLKLGNIYLAVTSGSTASSISVKINFADDTDETVSNLSILDWFGNPTTAQPALISNIGRVSRTGTNPETGGSKIFQITVPVSAANQTKNITSLTITNTAAGASATSMIPNVFAVAGQVVGSCPVVATVSAATASSSSINVNWTLSSVGDGAAPTYTLEVYTDAAHTTHVAGSPFTGLTEASQLVTGLTFGSTYYYQVKAGNGDCDSAFVTGSATIEYCVPTSTSPTTYYLTGVTTTGGYSNVANTGTGSGAYNNYSATMAVTKAAGTSFNYSITRNSGAATVSVYVDWNQDLDFTDEGEQIATYIGNFSAAATVNGSIAIPAGTATGNYRLRVRSVYYFNNTATPCGSLPSGEAEDYTITVAPQPENCATPDAPSIVLGTITGNVITATVTAPATTVTGYLLVRSSAATLTAAPVTGTAYAVGAEFGGGTVVAFGTALPTVNDYVGANTNYNYFVFSYNDGGIECFGPLYSVAASVNATTCAIATVNSGASNIGNFSANLNWSSVVGPGGSPATYTVEVYSDAEMTSLIETFTTDSNSYTYDDLDIATTYYYRVKASTTGCFNDAWSAIASFSTQSAYSPLDVTGFNADVIANGTGIANTSTTNAVDAVANAYVAVNYQRNAATTITSGLPVSRILSNSGIEGLQFMFADYSENNSLRLPAQNQAGTLTLTQPVKLSNLYLALTSGSGASDISVVVNFEDGSSQAANTFTLIDWYNAGTTAQPALISNIGRVNRADATGAVEAGNSKVFYVTVPVLEANQTKLVASVTITKTSLGLNEPVPNIFAVSGKIIDECPVLNSAFPFASANGANITFGLLAGSSAATSYNFEVYTDEARTIPVAGSPFTTTTTSLSVTGLNAATTYYYSAEAVNSACTSAPVTGSFTTTCTTPAAPTAAAQTVCGSATVAALTATGVEGAAFKWYASATAPTALATTATVSTGLYFVSQTVGTCEGPRTSVSVTVSTVAPPVTEPLTFCGSATAAELTATALEGATLTWYATVGGEPLEDTDALAATNYFVTQTLNGCTSTAASVAVSIRSLPILPTAVAQTFCSGATIADIEVTGSETGTFNWSLTEGGEALAATTPLVSGTYYVSQTIQTCTGGAIAVVITVNQTPEAPIAVSETVCEGTTLADLNVEGAEGATFTWSATEGGAALPATTVVESGSYFVTQTVGTCTSPAGQAAIVVSEIPDAPVAADQTFCSGATVAQLTATGEDNADFIWYFNGAVVSAETILQSGTYSVSQSLEICISPVTEFTVTINETPDAPEAEEEQSFTAGETVADLDATFADGAVVTWYTLDEDVYVAIPTTTALEDGVTYYVSQTTATCTSAYTAITANLTAGTGSFDIKGLTVYPNPASEIVNITSTENITHLVLNNLLGQKVMEQNANGTNAQLNVSQIAVGTYLLQVTAGSKSGTIKIVKN